MLINPLKQRILCVGKNYSVGKMEGNEMRFTESGVPLGYSRVYIFNLKLSDDTEK
jgi:hypothetical protein